MTGIVNNPAESNLADPDRVEVTAEAHLEDLEIEPGKTYVIQGYQRAMDLIELKAKKDGWANVEKPGPYMASDWSDRGTRLHVYNVHGIPMRGYVVLGIDSPEGGLPYNDPDGKSTYTVEFTDRAFKDFPDKDSFKDGMILTP